MSSKKSSQDQTIEQTPEMLAPRDINTAKPMARAITRWMKTILPAEIHPVLDKALDSLYGEQEGYVKSGNRTDYRRDQLAFASAGLEATSSGPVLVYSNMKGRREDDIIRCYLYDHVSTVLYPPTKQNRDDGKVKFQRHAKKRDAWVSSLGFAQAEVGKGKRFIFEHAGVDELRAIIRELAPERFEGTKAPTSTKGSIKLLAPVDCNSLPLRMEVYDPERASVGEAEFKESLLNVTILLNKGFSIAPDRQGNLTPLAETYFSAYKAAAAAPQQTAEVA